jgi:RNA polymerase sigma-70 factor, ECF subfamily
LTDVRARALESLAREEFQFVWRSLRRLGVWPDDRVDDAAQQVFEIATKKWSKVEGGKERAYLYRTAVLVAAEMRRKRRVGLREQLDDQAVDESSAEGTEPDHVLQERRYRAHLDQVLDQLDLPVREVFVLYEIERLSTVEIAELLEIKLGTAASRLRRGRELFQQAATRLRIRLTRSGDLP